ncbi:methylmalonyl-CoA epimerase [Cytobacillus gottheilii]|uniref:methylmalonyl-CoA epimerase n=1 Tax=Cytobacillus gottheilii TaxID=859144 RepID=UPI0009B95554|nr:methylmalonyl-CoA epimerase [Cytobacillus gottheilii]
MIKKIDHIGIAVSSLEKILPFYIDIIQLELLHIEEVESEGVRIAFIAAGETKIELIEPINEESAVARYIRKFGEGMHHIAFAVDSIEKRIEDINAKGIRMLNSQPKSGAGGAAVAFMHPHSTGRVLVELCERKE